VSCRGWSVAEQLLFNFTMLMFRPATWPHDQIYGMLGMLVNTEIPKELLPDYKLPFQQVYHRYARYIIENTGSLTVLGSNGGTFIDLPSWVTDLRDARATT
jgi:hypothetical protein